ncbi:MAG TPA: outer membrane beta-barrel protein [Bradyrhizobium sp.]|uniref:outer membrane protein n=1 Tax=Bradyrhizobium sp. TaxID=376 RepID=UPI002D7EA3F9|nr:outer membrane beta-barrel protein [Bradyrhizobium sp.]HET7888010.1 outer membrane beta-barrel protein [Bradyrhizobium sp.]
MFTHKSAILAAVAFATLAGPAAAADLPVKAAAPVSVWNWTGFYVGGNLGAGMASSGFTDPCFYCSSATPTAGFFTGGVQAGYNYQFGNGLVGIEADINGNSGFKNSVIGGGDPNSMAVGMAADVSGTIRARAGVVLNNTLVYATGGAAWADVRQTGTDFRNTNGPTFGTPTRFSANADGVLWGSVIGAGFEYALSPHWTVGGEFLHTMYQDRNAQIVDPIQVGGNACGNSPITNCAVRGQLTTDVARIRFNYRFGDETVARAYAPAGEMYRKAPAAAVYSWTGFYLGGNLGAGVGSTAFTDPCVYCSNATPTGGFFTGGVQAGYNYQFGNGLVGVEADVNGNSGFKKSLLGGDDQFALAVGTKADVSGTIRARAGVVVNNALVYTTAGAAWADVKQTGIELNNFTGPTLGTATGVTANASGILWGGVIGAGVEFAVSPNWTVGGELLHTVYQDRDANIFDPRQAGGNACLQFNRVPADNCVIRSQLTTDVLRIRANYRFGGPAGDPERYVPVATVYNWTGFHVGGNAGGGMAMSRFDDPCFFGGCSSATPTRGFFTGGAQAGYNYQFGRGLVGIEADLNGNSNFKNSVIGGDDQRAETVGIKADLSGTIRGRGGLVVNNALVYATGGAAWADARQTAVQFFNATNLANFGTLTGNTANASGVIWGSVVGAGVEFALSPNWTVGGEFLHTMYADRSANIANAAGVSACQSNVSAVNCSIRAQLNTDVARIRFNYRFDGPVVAKY